MGRTDAAGGGDEDAGEGGEEVEEAVGEVGEGGYAEDGALHKAAGVPGDEHAGDCGAILAGAAEQARFVAAFAIDVLEHGAGEDDAEELVGEGDVAEDAGEGCGGDEGGGAADEAQQHLHDIAQHAGGCDDAAEDLGADDEPDGWHHPGHAVCAHELVECGSAGLDVGGAVDDSHDAFVPPCIGDLCDECRLPHDGHDACHERCHEQHDHRGPAPGYHDAREHGHQQQPGRDHERLLQLGKECHLALTGDVHDEACYEEDDERDGEGGDGGLHHIADMTEEGCAGDAGGEHGGVGERG